MPSRGLRSGATSGTMRLPPRGPWKPSSSPRPRTGSLRSLEASTCATRSPTATSCPCDPAISGDSLASVPPA
eukprot:6236181-Lingulodinium_polyedra.AAC.1